LIASELFGHEKGAFTGAFERRIGRFEAADGGTLFLDEIGDLPPETQIALLRVLQEREFERVGSTKPVQVDVRVLALRERIDDLPVLAEYLVDRYAKKAGKRITSIDRSTLELLRNYSWPGNVRELQNVIERAVILCEASVLYVDETWFRRQARFRAADAVPFNLAVDTNERAIIERALSACGGRAGGANGAAARLGLPRQTLESKIKTLGINKFRFRQP
jgi:formate hydrogenlyase transcriptional activator